MCADSGGEKAALAVPASRKPSGEEEEKDTASSCSRRPCATDVSQCGSFEGAVDLICSVDCNGRAGDRETSMHTKTSTS